MKTSEKGLEFFNNTELFEKLHSKVYNTILHRSNYNKQLAEDICFGAYEKAITKVREGIYAEENKFIAWVLIMAQNMLVDHFRRESRYRNVSNGPISFDDFIKFSARIDDTHLEEIEIDVIDIDSEIGKVLNEQLNQIPKPQADVVRWVIYEGVPFKDIAEAKTFILDSIVMLRESRPTAVNLFVATDELR